MYDEEDDENSQTHTEVAVSERFFNDKGVDENTGKLYTLMDLIGCTIIDEDKTTGAYGNGEPVKRNLFDDIDLGLIKQKMLEIVNRL